MVDVTGGGRHELVYKQVLATADSRHLTNYDGRGNLSEKRLIASSESRPRPAALHDPGASHRRYAGAPAKAGKSAGSEAQVAARKLLRTGSGLSERQYRPRRSNATDRLIG